MRTIHLVRVVAAAAVGILLAGVAAAPSYATTVLWERFRPGIGGLNAEYLYLTVAGYSTANGANAQVADNDGSNTGSQLWQSYDLGGDKFAFRNAGTTDWKALSIKNNAATNGTQVVQWQFESTNKWEQWTEVDSGGVQRFKNVGTNLCLAVAGGGSAYRASGANVIIWNCDGGQDQNWTWVYQG
jgi:hypothetical protein